MRVSMFCRLLLVISIASSALAGANSANQAKADDARVKMQQSSAASGESSEEAEVMPSNRTQRAVADLAWAAEFTLEDQFGKAHTYAFPKDKVSVLLFADREGSEQIEGWVRPLYDKYRNAIDVDGVALLKGVPEWMRGTVRFLFRKQAAHPVMMDWTGETTEQFDCRAKVASVFVVDT
ncbi:MAG: hypothetical protein K1Y02_25360, partial [Candidatus Hydrogenedentes bacterium]|nr:hypothetical protein [Candidatus Hydrogenedentota bacterium]